MPLQLRRRQLRFAQVRDQCTCVRNHDLKLIQRQGAGLFSRGSFRRFSVRNDADPYGRKTVVLLPKPLLRHQKLTMFLFIKWIVVPLAALSLDYQTLLVWQKPKNVRAYASVVVPGARISTPINRSH